jgi:predicted transcriptional regulator
MKNNVNKRNSDAIKILESSGYNCVGIKRNNDIWDIIAYNSNSIRFIQVKNNDTITEAEKESLKEFKDLPPGASKELWVFHDGKSVPTITKF